MAIYPEFLKSPKSLFNLLQSSSKLRSLSRVQPIYVTFVLTFAPGDIGGYVYKIPDNMKAFLWQMGYYCEEALRGKLAGEVRIDEKIIFADPAHLRPSLDSEFTQFEPIEGTIKGRWIAGAAGSLQVHTFGMLLRQRFYDDFIEPLFDKAGEEMGIK